MTNDVNITLVGDEELMKVLTNLDYKTQHKVLKRITKDTAQKTLVGPLRQASPYRTGTLRASMGSLSGKSKRTAVAFAGPRMGGKHKGYVANILEHSKGMKRIPKGAALNTPWGPRKSVKGFRKIVFVVPTLKRHLKDAENYFTKSIRTIMEREMKKARKTGII